VNVPGRFMHPLTVVAVLATLNVASEELDAKGGSMMSIDVTRNLFLWCTVINYGFLLIWFLFFLMLNRRHYEQ
jgi:hypothetical protein